MRREVCDCETAKLRGARLSSGAESQRNRSRGSWSIASPWSRGAGHKRLTCKDLWTLEILIRMQVARGQGEIDSNQQEEQVGSPPHCSGC